MKRKGKENTIYTKISNTSTFPHLISHMNIQTNTVKKNEKKGKKADLLIITDRFQLVRSGVEEPLISMPHIFQTLISPSKLPLHTTNDPSSPSQTAPNDFTGLSCPSNTPKQSCPSPLPRLQILTVRSADPLNSKSPSLIKHKMAPPWPLKTPITTI